MKRLYVKKAIFRVNGTFVYSHIGTLRYGETGESQTIQLNTFDEAIAILPQIRRYGFTTYLKKHLFKPFEETLNVYWLNMNFTRKTFKPITIEVIYLEEEENDYAIQRLVEKLPANEFIEYLKDKGVIL